MSELIDTTEMYLKTIFELEEEGIVPLRARIGERLHQSGPTVSQTVARMERDGLLHLDTDRHLEFTEQGRLRAMRVMRKHRLVERLLVDVIGLDWELVHVEACRWEHVVSEAVERRLVDLLHDPTESPYGNPIPGLAELGRPITVEDFHAGVRPLPSVVGTGSDVEVTVRRISEPLQTDEKLMAELRRAGAVPGGTVQVRHDGARLVAGSAGETVELTPETASHVFVSA
ncbi:MAG TPA: iron dependent repressor, metal binding and dimerization domain protein [Jiangellaceae bacterium]|jgi:DtxR family transcriptional regulator, Mn-dependent transcriptional regulator|nr:iron dependent repressor, metal binding and dimerization domain protein [Jiangellaceae bacterium]